MVKKLQVSTTISRPDENKELLARLQKKLKEYGDRIGEYLHPGQQLLEHPDGFFKYRILNTVLESGEAEYETLFKKIADEFPGLFQTQSSCFPDAWAVIWDYCANSGKHAKNSKTGKPGLSK